MTRDEIIGGFEREIRRIRREPKEKMLGICITVDEAEEIAELLKDGVPIPPVMMKGRYFTTPRCGKCKRAFPTGQNPNFCSWCGQAVKWE